MCANCHGTNGQARGDMKPLAGVSAEKIVAQLADYKSGNQPATIMYQIAKGYTDEQIGAATRGIHETCRKALRAAVQLQPILSGEEGSAVTVPAGFDPSSVRLVGAALTLVTEIHGPSGSDTPACRE